MSDTAGHPGLNPFPALAWLERQVTKSSQCEGVDIDAVHFKRGAVSAELAQRHHSETLELKVE